MDDSGTRHPDRQLDLSSPKRDWFALGGVLVRDRDEAQCRSMYEDFRSRWSLTYPLHSEEIRHYKKNFRWLNENPERRSEFLTSLQEMLLTMPVIGMACVIDRPGYHKRYHEKYPTQKWSLCRSSFAIGVERASKFVREKGCKLNVFVEMSDRKTDERVRRHFDELKKTGHPFDVLNASKYAPLEQPEINDTLYDFHMKNKSSPMMQIADLYLYPICRGGYEPTYRPFDALQQASRLIDCHVSDVTRLGLKYYCFESVRAKKTGAEGDLPSAPGQPSEEDLLG